MSKFHCVSQDSVKQSAISLDSFFSETGKDFLFLFDLLAHNAGTKCPKNASSILCDYNGLGIK